ncbi:MAG: RecB family exonuclease, partial [Candidatus Dormibacteria bacterium]
PEPARAAAPFTGHFSASSLTAFVECARKWYYRYLCNVVDDPGSSASFYGTAFHAALERFHQNFPRVDGEPAEVLEQRLDGAIVEAFDPFRRSFGTPAEFELQLRRARRTAKHYLRWVRERARTRPFSVVATEAKIELLLDGREFVGYIDRLDRDDATGDVTVIDYKTGAIAQSAAEYRAGIVDQVEFQLPLYYWARTAAGDRVRSLTLVPLKDALADVRPIELEIVPYGNGSAQRGAPSGTISIGELERARGRMAALAEQLATGAIERFATTTDPTACTYCAYRNACRERPHDGEERFGR